MRTSLFLSLAKSARPPASILSLHAGGEKGGTWFPHFTRSMFQDEAMTIPAVVGMPVVKMLDLSGNGNTITFTDVTLQQDAAGQKYLAFNGSTSGGVTAAINFTGTNKITAIAGVRKLSDAAIAIVCELSTSAGTNGAFWITAPQSAGVGNYGGLSCGTLSAEASTAANYASPHSAVLTLSGDISGDSAIFRVNGTEAATSAADQGAGVYGNYALYIGRRAGTSLPFNGRLYGLIVRGAASTAGQIADAERYMARLTGVNL